MPENAKIPIEAQALYKTGEILLRDVREHINSLPDGSDNRANHLENYLETTKAELEELRDRVHRWFSLVCRNVQPNTTFTVEHINVLLRRTAIALESRRFCLEYIKYTHSVPPQMIMQHNVEISVPPSVALDEAVSAIGEALRIIRTAPLPLLGSASTAQITVAKHVPNTAFILMWMDKNRPELVDVHEAVKDVFGEFGILAIRADEVQHQDRITDLVLEQIANSEFLFADLSGERPNVYYEVGYAHALGKRPILYRRTGTPLHFDLSVHNVPEYENVTKLRQLVRERLVAITGRTPNS